MQNIQIMEELGYTVREVNPETGKKKRRMDWTKTRAVANREMHIYREYNFVTVVFHQIIQRICLEICYVFPALMHAVID